MPELKEALHNSSDNQQGKDNQDPPPAFQQGDNDDAGAPVIELIADPTSTVLVGLSDHTPIEVPVGLRVNTSNDELDGHSTNMNSEKCPLPREYNPGDYSLPRISVHELSYCCYAQILDPVVYKDAERTIYEVSQA